MVTDVERLLAEATPLPWRMSKHRHEREYGFSGKTRKGMSWEDFAVVYGFDEDDDTDAEGEANAQLVEYAVNRLPAYEAAVEALERLVERAVALDNMATWSALNRPEVEPFRAELKEAVAALARLRETVSADDWDDQSMEAVVGQDQP